MKFTVKRKMIILMMFLLGVAFMNISASANTFVPKQLGVDSVSGVVKSVEAVENNVFLVMIANNEEKAFYASSDRDVASIALKLNVGDNIDLKYALGTPQKYLEFMAMPMSSIEKKDITSAPIVTPPKAIKVVGTSKVAGKVKKVEKVGSNVFLTLTLKDGSTSTYYISSTSPNAKAVLKLKAGNKVEVKYVLGTPAKYKDKTAMPLSNTTIIK